MAKSIEVCKQNVLDLLKTGRKNAFVVPEYQRPYAWTEDEVITLFSDIMNFVKSEGAKDKNKTYFLGSIVSYENEDGEQEIIDGQQRLTSIFLLLRAIFDRLEKSESSSEYAQNFIGQIGPSIWSADPLSNKVDRSRPLILTKVVGDRDSVVLKKILETGIAEKSARDNYSRNYCKFQELFVEASKEDALGIYDFIYAVLNQAILLPITAGDHDSALTIFSTLNDRGLPLSDADIFKAKIYGNLKTKEGDFKGFVKEWQELQERCERAHESMQSLFYYFMFFLRAAEKDSDTTTPGVRKYFLSDKCARLFDAMLMSHFREMMNFWEFVNCGLKTEEESWMLNSEIRCALDVLSSYPNEFWKYPVVIYYLVHHMRDGFERSFLLFLRKLAAVLLSNYLVRPSVSAVKGAILKLNVEAVYSDVPRFSFGVLKADEIIEKIKVPHTRMVRMMLKMLAYGQQKELLPIPWEIEHILPRKWKASYFPGQKDEYVNEMVEHIGNKIPFEKILNIVASNGYFEKKREEYAGSRIQMVKALSELQFVDWKIEQIIERDAEVAKSLMALLDEYESAYERKGDNLDSAPTEEQKRQIELFKERGWI